MSSVSPRRRSAAQTAAPNADDAVRAAMHRLPADARPLVLAVSGGGDSMALLHAFAQWGRDRVATVATFDHGTGVHARDAADLVAAESRRLGLPVVRQRALRAGRNEAEWREARWTFLKRVARAHGARVATAHTEDDQLETIVQRWFRGAGARGLAALAARGPVVRPFLGLTRAQLDAFREARSIPSLIDPANYDRRHQRVRMRRDLLPLYEQVSPAFRAAVLSIGERAAQWRDDVDALVETMPFVRRSEGVWQLERRAVAGWSQAQLGVVWPAMLGRLGVSLPGEGTRRLIRFTIGNSRAGELGLPGGVRVIRRGEWLEVRSGAAAADEHEAREAPPRREPVGAALHWPGWRFERLPEAPGPADESLSPDLAAFPATGVVEVRRWAPGDRICTASAPAGRRISRYLAECGVPRLDRRGWPVVLLDGAVVWVPGVCRGLAAPYRSGWSDSIWYRSEREFR